MGRDSAEIAKAQWRDAFDQITRDHEGDEVTIEILDEEYGDNEEVEWLPLTSIDYDEHDDAVIVTVGGFDRHYPAVLHHIVEHPVRVEIAPVSEQIPVGISVTDFEGDETIVAIRRRGAR